ncbi:MAG: YiiX/YebB-like N1pC/P60 family cysteine hydrolase [Candidatus Zixiibacteriota bacterium]
MSSRFTKLSIGIVALLCVIYALLLIPDSDPPVPIDSEKQSFAWNRDEYWSELETAFKQARQIECTALAPQIHAGFTVIDSLLIQLKNGNLEPGAPLFAKLENAFFRQGVFLAACPGSLNEYIKRFSLMRTLAKEQSLDWDMNSPTARDCIYRLLYGGRTAIEEVMMQAPKELVQQTVLGANESSVTPSAEIIGVEIHSGDILISRGGAPTSALIARGNDYPGNFSHAALAYVDDSTGEVSIVESHIEKGVAIASIDDYIRDTKLRVMVMRLRSDLPFMVSDPMLPHEAARYAMKRAGEKHIPYDFAMDTEEPSKLFCSEVVSDAYRHVGINLWTALSHISSPGVKAWLWAFGIRNFTFEEPSDLEYDPQLRVVAEWRDYETLFKDRLDNAVVDIMLESADHGEKLEYDWYMLPIGRVLKLYSSLLNQFGSVGPVPEGMSTTAALRNTWFSSRHSAAVEMLIIQADEFKKKNGYSPPYWEIVKLARQIY